MGRSRCSGEQGNEFSLGFPGEMHMVSSTQRPEEQERVPVWRQEFENRLWRLVDKNVKITCGGPGQGWARWPRKDR